MKVFTNEYYFNISLSLSGTWTGGAWLSSARAIRFWVKSHNECNPHA